MDFFFFLKSFDRFDHFNETLINKSTTKNLTGPNILNGCDYENHSKAGSLRSKEPPNNAASIFISALKIKRVKMHS